MRLIHCADLHLDSKMTANLDRDQAKERKHELLNTYEKMVAYAAQNQVDGILIAGDMFDTKNISATTRNAVLRSIVSHPDICFFYLKGNHDQDNFLSGLEEIPSNLYLFDSGWKSYSFGAAVITGAELCSGNSGNLYHELILDHTACNIVMLHGQENETGSKDKAEIINLRALRNKGIDYLALGHIHGYKRAELDSRSVYCYPGCLEGRGFDECGSHGFVLLDIDETTKVIRDTFVPFASRNLHTLYADVSDCMTSAEMAEKITSLLQKEDCSGRDLLKLVLTGELDVECEKDVDYIASRFKEHHYFVKVCDETRLKISIENYLHDESLKGEYVRTILQNEKLDMEEKMIIIRYGLQAIAGEEIQ